MIYRKEKGFDSFACLAGACPDTCCGGWDVGIDEESLGRYLGLEGALGNRIKNSIDWEGGCFAQYQGRCGMLDEEGLCEIHKELGGDALCDTCREYPRHVEEYENRREYSLSLSCPEAARMVLEKKEKAEFLEKEDGEEEEFEEFDRELFRKLRKTRRLFLEILQNRNISTKERINRMIEWAARLQEKIDADELEGMEKCLEEAGVRSKSQREAEALEKHLGFLDEGGYSWKKGSFSVFYEMDWLRPEWGERVERTWKALYGAGEEAYEEIRRRFYSGQGRAKDLELMKEQLLAAYIDLYLCGAAYDGDLFSKTALAVFSVLCIEEFLLASFAGEEKNFRILHQAVQITYQFAREVEHSDNNLLLLEEWAGKRMMVQKNWPKR